MCKFERRKLGVLFMVCCLGIGIKAANVYAQEETEGVLKDSPIGISADIAINSDYVWRGFTLDEDSVMQQGIYISAYGLTASLWGSFDMDNNDSLNSDEVDYTIDYTHGGDKFSLSVGYTYYDFPAADIATQEFYVGVGIDMFLSPNLTWYHDYGDEDSGGGDGDYAVLELSRSFVLGDGATTVDLSGHIGYNNELFIEGDGGDAAIGVGLTIPLTENCSFSPNINYSIPFGDLEDANDGNQDNRFYGGFTLAFGL